LRRFDFTHFLIASSLLPNNDFCDRVFGRLSIPIGHAVGIGLDYAIPLPCRKKAVYISLYIFPFPHPLLSFFYSIGGFFRPTLSTLSLSSINEFPTVS
jgi:hypothetical protein